MKANFCFDFLARIADADREFKRRFLLIRLPPGPLGLPVPKPGFGGGAVMTINVIPAPEPGRILMICLGALGLVHARRGKR